MRALAVLFGASFTVATSLALGSILIRALSIRLMRLEERLLAFVTGAACLSGILFFVCAAHVARRAVFLALGLLALGGAYWMRAHRPPEVKLPWLAPLWKWLFVAVFAVFTCLYFFSAMAPEMSPDGTSYHVPVAQHYLRAHGFDRVTTNIYANISHGVELLFLFGYAFGAHSATSLIHFSFLVALPWLMLSYGRRFGFGPAGAAGGLFAFVSPVIGMDGSVAYNDVAIATILFALFYVLQIWDAERDPCLLVLVGILAGFAFAAKYTAFLATPYAVGFVAWKHWRKAGGFRWLKPALLVGSVASLLIVPWLLRNWLWFQNPVTPFANQIFRNPYVHVYFEQNYVKFLRGYGMTDLRQIPLEVTIRGATLNGLLGPLFLLTPIALLALRWKQGRQLLLAGLIFLLPYSGNIGTRFLIPVVPFASLAIALAFSYVPPLLLAVVVIHAVISWPSVLRTYCSPQAWRLDKIPLKAALRIEPEDAYLRRKFNGYLVDRMLEEKTPPGATIFSLSQLAESYTTRNILVRFQAASNETLGDMVWTPIFLDFQPSLAVEFAFPQRVVRKIRAVETKTSNAASWSISEFRVYANGQELPRLPQWRLTAQPNPWEVQLAFDNSPVTRWMTWEPARQGMYVEVDFSAPQPIDRVRLECSPEYYDQTVKLEAMDAEGRRSTVAEEGQLVRAPVTVGYKRAAMRELKARGIHYLMASSDDYGSDNIRRQEKAWGVTLAGEAANFRLYHID